MSSDQTPPQPEQGRRDAVRAKAQLVHAQQSRARVIRRTTVGIVIAMAVGAAAIVVTWAVASAVSQPLLNPRNMTDDGMQVTVFSATDLTAASAEVPDASASLTTPDPDEDETDDGDGDAATADEDAEEGATGPVEIRVYVDFLAGGAGEFQQANAAQLAQWSEQGAATVTYHPVALLTAKSNGTKFSLRAASAAACVASISPDTFFAYTNELLMQQPEVDTDGLSDTELADLAIAVGSQEPKRLRTCIEDGRFTTWVQEATQRALAGPLPGTEDEALTGAPLVLVNGTPYVGALDDPAEFAQYVLTLSSDAYYQATPTPTPTPTDE